MSHERERNEHRKKLRGHRLELWALDLTKKLSNCPVRSEEFLKFSLQLQWTNQQMIKNEEREVFVLSPAEHVSLDWNLRQKYLEEHLANHWNDRRLADQAHECWLEAFALFEVDVAEQTGSKRNLLIHTLLPEMIQRLRNYALDIEDLTNEEKVTLPPQGRREFSPETRELLMADPTAPGNERSREENLDPYGQFDVYPNEVPVDREFDEAFSRMEIDRANDRFIDESAAQIRNDATAVREEEAAPELTIHFDDIDQFSEAVNTFRGATEGDWVERQDQREQTQQENEQRRRDRQRLSRDLEALYDVQDSPEAIANLCRGWGWTEEEIRYCLRQREIDMASDPHTTNPNYHNATPGDVLAEVERQEIETAANEWVTRELRNQEAEEVAEQARRDLED